MRRFSSSLQSQYSLIYSWFAAQFEEAKPKTTVASLDGVRAIDCLTIVMFHINIATEDMNIWHKTGYPLLASVVAAGGAGVSRFFVLSGFLLFSPYVKALLFEKSWPDTRLFYMRRALRIIPGYYFSLFVLVLWSSPDFLQPHNWKRLLLFPVFLMDSSTATNQAINGPYWSLAVEWQFYLLLPLIAVGIRCLAVAVTARPARRFWVVFGCLLGMIAWGLCTRYWGLYFTAHSSATFLVPRHVLNIILFFTYGASGKFLEDFAVGMLLVLCYTYMCNSISREKYMRWMLRLSPWLWGIDVLALMFMAMRYYSDRYTWSIFPQLFQGYSWTNELGFSLAYSCCILAILFDTSMLKRFFEWTPLCWIGLISYSLYIWHLPILLAFEHNVGPSLAGLNHFVAYSLFWVWELLIAVPFAFVIYVKIEKPAMRLSDRLRSRLAARPEKSTA